MLYIYISALNSLVCFGIMLFDMRYLYGFMFLKWFLAMFFFGVKVFSNVILNKISAYMYIYKLHIASLISYALVHVSSLFGT
jgi:hypothetical protein